MSAALLTVTGGVAWATIPGADNTIEGCYANNSGRIQGRPYSKGDVRVVDSAESCRDYETPISWNQKGPKGDPGPAGPAGPVGPMGPQGPQGIAGLVYKEAVYDVIVSGEQGGHVVCPEGKRVVSGGFFYERLEQTPLEVFGSRPFYQDGTTFSGWSVYVYNPTSTAKKFTVFAVCATAP